MQLPSYISTRIQYQHKSLVDIIDGLSEELIRRNVTAAKWSIFENIVHLATYQHILIARLKLILESDNPVFERYTAEADPHFHDNCSKTTREIMQDLLTTRKEMAAGILNFDEPELIKTGTHPFFGKMTVLQWLDFFLLHEAHHLYTIFRLTAELRKEQAG
jgi:uncharacterized damage-inducible protein DinB